jgi:hypothetical protein
MDFTAWQGRSHMADQLGSQAQPIRMSFLFSVYCILKEIGKLYNVILIQLLRERDFVIDTPFFNTFQYLTLQG